jgi:hypothetical protein
MLKTKRKKFMNTERGARTLDHQVTQTSVDALNTKSLALYQLSYPGLVDGPPKSSTLDGGILPRMEMIHHRCRCYNGFLLDYISE